ncbi:MAG: cupredoxin domain-containing protein [Candidatus Levybacteria bacterium]|nr:cupredoxin domain-containing protein [Candidatus Levybacteria bacterium]
MNNKTLVTIIVVLLIAGVVIVVGGSFFNKKTSPESNTNTSTQQQTQQQPKAGEITTVNNEKIMTINATDSGFEPNKVTIKTGTRVLWTSSSDKTVAIASDDHPTHQKYPPLNLGGFEKGSSVQLVFDKPGTYTYHDHLNPNNKGTVVVE